MTEKDLNSITDTADDLITRIRKAVENVECCCGSGGCRDTTSDANTETVTGRNDKTA